MTLVVLAVSTGCSSTIAPESHLDCESPNNPIALPARIHPKVFWMVVSWLSDGASPVVTEISLDAVAQNDDQFYWGQQPDPDMNWLERNGWVSWHDPDSQAWQRYRIVDRMNNHYIVEYQNNGGGTLTTTATISFELDTRSIKIESQPAQVPVLRVLSYRRGGNTEER